MTHEEYAAQMRLTHALVTGNTFPVRAALKALRGAWDAEARGWWLTQDRAEEARRIIAHFDATYEVLMPEQQSQTAPRITYKESAVMEHPTLEQIAAFEQRLAARAQVRFGTDWNRLPPIPPDDYPNLGYTVKVYWSDGHGFAWHTDAVPDVESIRQALPGVTSFAYSAD